MFVCWRNGDGNTGQEEPEVMEAVLDKLLRRIRVQVKIKYD